MDKICYRKEDISMVLRMLDNISVKGVENAKYIAVIHDKLTSEGEMIREGEEDGSNHSV